jgi:hypothetical protein
LRLGKGAGKGRHVHQAGGCQCAASTVCTSLPIPPCSVSARLRLTCLSKPHGAGCIAHALARHGRKRGARGAGTTCPLPFRRCSLSSPTLIFTSQTCQSILGSWCSATYIPLRDAAASLPLQALEKTVSSEKLCTAHLRKSWHSYGLAWKHCTAHDWSTSSSIVHRHGERRPQSRTLMSWSSCKGR